MIDYQVSMSTAGGSYVVLVTGNTATTFTAVSLSFGVSYSFTVKARNSYGYSVSSSSLTMLCGAAPETPAAPTTSVTGK